MTQTIHDLPRIERPREKLVKYGPDKLSNPELLAIILRNGQKGLTILDITKKFFKDYDNEKILSMDYEELKNLKGFGNVKACEILATIELGKRLLKQKKNIILLIQKIFYTSIIAQFRASAIYFLIHELICKFY